VDGLVDIAKTKISALKYTAVTTERATTRPVTVIATRALSESTANHVIHVTGSTVKTVPSAPMGFASARAITLAPGVSSQTNAAKMKQFAALVECAFPTRLERPIVNVTPGSTERTVASKSAVKHLFVKTGNIAWNNQTAFRNVHRSQWR